jgi:hypothetical protein
LNILDEDINGETEFADAVDSTTDDIGGAAKLR